MKLASTLLSLGLVSGNDQHLIPPNLNSCLSNVATENTRIYHGSQVNPNSWPWAAKLQINSDFPFYCGATILSDQWILTSSSLCCDGMDANEFSVVIGTTFMNDTTFEYPVAEMIIHPDYRDYSVPEWDFCLIGVAYPMDLERAGASVICLPDEGNHVQPGTEQCFTAGWGDDGIIEPDEYVTDVLVSLAVNIYSADVCTGEGNWDEAADLGSGDSGSGSDPDYLSYNGTDIGAFCAGYMAGDLDSCDYDEGGPLVCIQDNTPVLYGVNSWPSCGTEGLPTLYGRVADVVGWIAESTQPVCSSSYPRDARKCPDFRECLTKEYPGIRQAGGGLTDGNNARSSTKVRCDDDEYFNGNDGRSNYKVTCACNYSKGCRWVWKNGKPRECIAKETCPELKNIVWGGYTKAKYVGKDGASFKLRFYYESTPDGRPYDYSAGWTVFLVIDKQISSTLGDMRHSVTSLDADYVSYHAESDCSSTVYQFQSNDFHGHSKFTKAFTHNRKVYHELRIDFRFIDLWELEDLTPQNVKNYFSNAKLGWVQGHHDNMSECVAEHFSERPPARTRIGTEYPENNTKCKST